MTDEDARATGAGTAHGADRAALYWRRNLRLMAGLLAVWFAVSFGAGILFVEPLNGIRLFGFPLGFFMAQQGAIYVFVALIFIYAWRMNRIERALDMHETDIDAPIAAGPGVEGSGAGRPGMDGG